ncbi:hypothetical protein LPJ74_005539 [Coemansia sp. RSA 1843]|nr:hypothetical protein LPJ74_005539 [Coemansia sp. RSA 1843]
MDNRSLLRGLLVGIFYIPLTEMGLGANDVKDIRTIPCESDINDGAPLASDPHTPDGPDSLAGLFRLNVKEIKKMFDNSTQVYLPIAIHKSTILETTRDWYDGYYIGRFSGKYNPWLVSSYIGHLQNILKRPSSSRTEDVERIIMSAARSCWTFTGTTGPIEKQIDRHRVQLSRLAKRLLDDYETTMINNQPQASLSIILRYMQLDMTGVDSGQFSEPRLLMLCLYAEYVTLRTLTTVCIPNREVRQVWLGLFARAVSEKEYANHVAGAIAVMIWCSALTHPDQPSVDPSHVVVSRKNHAGVGFCDYMMRLYNEMNQSNQFGIIIEFKLIPATKKNNTDTHKTLANQVLAQIARNRYKSCLAGCLECLEISMAIGDGVVYTVSQLYKRDNTDNDWRPVDSLTDNQHSGLVHMLVGFRGIACPPTIHRISRTSSNAVQRLALLYSRKHNLINRTRGIHTSLASEMKWHVQIVAPSTHNTRSTSVLVYFSSGRYLFNCGEGVQRLSFENKVRVSKLSAIFLSRVNWETMGGLPGMLLTMADSGMKGVSVSGGRNLTHALAAARHFILRTDLGLCINEMHDGDAAAEFRDSNVHIVPVHAYPNGRSAKDDAQPSGFNESESHEIRKLLAARAFGEPKQLGASIQANDKKAKKERSQHQAKKKGYYNDKCSGAAVEEYLQRLQKAEEEALEKKRAHSPESGRNGIGRFGMGLPQTTPSSAALSYILEGPVVPGKFDVAAAQALGLRPGPLYGKLTAGESVVGPNGDTIHPSQCVGPERPGGIVVIIDCPSVDYIESLTANPKLAPFLDGEGRNKDKQKQLMVIVHGLGLGVSQDKRYQDWARRFPSHVRHIVSAPELIPDSNPFQRHLRVQAAIAAIDNKTFVLPQSSSAPDLPLSTFMSGKNVFAAEFNAVYDIEPKFKVDKSLIRPTLTPDTVYRNAKAALKTGMQSKRPVSSANAATPQESDANEVSDTELVLCPIGTGSSVPSIYRNVSANIISIKGYGGIVLDCGEATVSLLKRFLGYPHRNVHNRRVYMNYVEFVSSLKMLYISHMHADHHLGAVLLLQEWSQLTKTLPSPLPRLTIVAPWRFWAWIEDISGVQDVGFDRLDFVGCQELRLLDKPQTDPETIKATDALKASLGLTEISTCFVIHCPWAYGLSITHKNGWRVVYSGDTRPCTNLVTLGRAGDRPPTVLLHEATHTDDLIKDAIAKRHTTVSEAVAMALGMGAENLLMTHFSQRCLSIPNWKPENVFDVKVPRYGYIASSAQNRQNHRNRYADNIATYSEASEVAKEAQVDQQDDVYEDNDIAAEMEAVEETPIPTDDAKAAKEELLKDMNDSSSDTSSVGTCSSSKIGSDSSNNDRQSFVNANVNVAVAFDMSAYSTRDFVRYRRNIKRLKRATWEEIQLFIAEEQQQNSTDEDNTELVNTGSSGKKAPVSKKKAASPKGKTTNKGAK